MGRLYPRLSERPKDFLINPASPLYHGLHDAVLGVTNSTSVFTDCSPYRRILATHRTAAGVYITFDSYLRRFVAWFQYYNCPSAVWTTAGKTTTMSQFVWQWPDPERKCAAYGAANCFYVGASNSPYGIYFFTQIGAQVYEATYEYPIQMWHASCHVFTGQSINRYVNAELIDTVPVTGTLPLSTYITIGGLSANTAYRGYVIDGMTWLRPLSESEIAALSDPSNVDLRIHGVPLILPPRRRFFPSVEIPAPTFNPAWAQHVNSYIGLGRA